MDDDNEDFEFFSPEQFLEAIGAASKQSYRRARWMDIPVLGVGLLYGLSRAVTNTLADTASILADHANFHVQQDEFREQAAREIETLIAGDDNG